MTMLRTWLELGAQREPDADLLRPLLHRVRHQPVDADRREQQRGAAEDGQQQHVEVRARRRLDDDLVHRLDPRDRQPAARLPQLLLNRRGRTRAARRACARPSRARRACEFSAVTPSGICANGTYIAGCGSWLSAAVPHVADDADDLPRPFVERRARPLSDHELIAQRIALRPDTAAPSSG